MKIGIFGTGRVGGTLGRRFIEIGNQVIFGSRDPQCARVRSLIAALGTQAEAVPIGDVRSATGILFVATPWEATQQAIAAAGDLSGRIVVDCTNPIGADGLVVGTNSSGGELVAEWAPGASVVKAFNTTGSDNMANPTYGDQSVTMFICGDHENTKEIVGRLAAQIGFQVVDCGPLEIARYLEPMAMLWITLAYNQRLGLDIAFKLIQRPSS